MSEPHKHAELIHAWADGAKIQMRNADTIWIDTDHPMWNIGTEYRIKPTTKLDLAIEALVKISLYNSTEAKQAHYALKTIGAMDD